MHGIGIGVAGAMFAASAAAIAAPAPQSLQFALNTVTDAQDMHFTVTAKVWVKGDKARLETDQPMTGPTLILVHGPKIHTLHPRQKRGTVATVETGTKGPKSPWEFLIANVDQITRGGKKVGQEKLDGFTCDVYSMTRDVEGGQVTVKSWITQGTQPRLPIRVDTSIQVKQSSMTMNQSQTSRMKEIRFGVPLPDSLFAIPAGYKIIQAGAPGIPGLPPAP